MAEIKIEKKSPVWPWILLVLLIIAGIIYFMTKEDEEAVTEIEQTEQVEQAMERETDESEEMMDENNPMNESMDESIVAFKNYVSNDEGMMGVDHEYTHEAFDRLVTAIKVVADNIDYNIETDLGMVKQKSDQIKKDPMSLKHANMIKDGFLTVVNTFQNMQEAKFSQLEMEVEELNQLANKVKNDTPTLDQKVTIKSFFDKSADLLITMNNSKNN